MHRYVTLQFLERKFSVSLRTWKTSDFELSLIRKNIGSSRRNSDCERLLLKKKNLPTYSRRIRDNVSRSCVITFERTLITGKRLPLHTSSSSLTDTSGRWSFFFLRTKEFIQFACIPKKIEEHVCVSVRRAYSINFPNMFVLFIFLDSSYSYVHGIVFYETCHEGVVRVWHWADLNNVNWRSQRDSHETSRSYWSSMYTTRRWRIPM